MSSAACAISDRKIFGGRSKQVDTCCQFFSLTKHDRNPIVALVLKWSQKTGQLAKVYSKPPKGYKLPKRRKFTDKCKAKVALEALSGDKTKQGIAAGYQLHPNQESIWKRQVINGMVDVFSGGQQSGPTEAEIKELHAKIGRSAVENVFFRRAEAMSPAKTRAMTQRDHPELSISRQYKLVRISRSAFYDASGDVNAERLAMTKKIDRVFTKYPLFGNRQLFIYAETARLLGNIATGA
ncbi:transposase [Sulfitobacter sp. SBS6]|uniref:transposase n=1 Tax=Sulfitobacter sp. SBS6 TaxID=3401755 RepID=UPI003AB06A2C